MRAGVPSACSRRRARTSGVGRHRRRMSSTSPGMSIHGSADTSWAMSAIGNSGARSSGPTGSLVAGCSGGWGGFSRWGTTLNQAWGSRRAASTNESSPQVSEGRVGTGTAAFRVRAAGTAPSIHRFVRERRSHGDTGRGSTRPAAADPAPPGPGAPGHRGAAHLRSAAARAAAPPPSRSPGAAGARRTRAGGRGWPWSTASTSATSSTCWAARRRRVSSSSIPVMRRSWSRSSASTAPSRRSC